MKTDVLTSLPIVPEEYDTKHTQETDYEALDSRMADVERCFINGLIRYYMPTSLLEVGVATGGGTCVLLDAIKDIQNSKLVSIDKAEMSITTPDATVGHSVSSHFDCVPENWTLVKGKDPSAVMGRFEEKSLDFAIIDTAHLHPVESLNFLCLLPYMKDGAILILHDISYHLFSKLSPLAHKDCYGARILLSSLVGPKLFPLRKYQRYVHQGYMYGLGLDDCNIAAIQINDDTRKYVSNVFHSLKLLWGLYPEDDVESIRALLEKHYDKSNIDLFDECNRFNAVYHYTERRTISLAHISEAIRSNLSEDMIFYGAGANMKRLLSLFELCGIPFDYPIWDINAYKIKNVNGYSVCSPDFETKVSGKTAVITIDDKEAAFYAVSRLHRLGYDVIESKLDFLNF